MLHKIFIGLLIIGLLAFGLQTIFAESPPHDPVQLSQVPALLPAESEGATASIPPCSSGIVAIITLGNAGEGQETVRLSGKYITPRTIIVPTGTETSRSFRVCSHGADGMTTVSLCYRCSSYGELFYDWTPRIYGYITYTTDLVLTDIPIHSVFQSRPVDMDREK